MITRRNLRGALLTLAFTVACEVPALADAIRVEAKLFYAKPMATQVNDITFRNIRATTANLSSGSSGDPDAVFAPVFALIESGKVELPGFTLEIKDGEIAWKAEPGQEPTVLIAPTITTPLNEEAEIKVVQCVPYFDRKDDGTFVLKALEASIRFECTVSKGPAGDLTLDWKSTMQRVASRKPIEGIRLDIGEPVLAVTTTNHQTIVKPGTWSAFIQLAGDGGHLITLVRVSSDKGVQK